MFNYKYLREMQKLCDFIPSLFAVQRDFYGQNGAVFTSEWSKMADYLRIMGRKNA